MGHRYRLVTRRRKRLSLDRWPALLAGELDSQRPELNALPSGRVVVGRGPEGSEAPSLRGVVVSSRSGPTEARVAVDAQRRRSRFA
jgi:hypothetical protein